MSTTGGIEGVNSLAALRQSTPRGSGNALGEGLAGVGNTSSSLTKEELETALDSMAKFRDSLDELSTSVRLRQPRGARLQDDIPAGAHTESELDDEGHQKVETLRVIAKADARDSVSTFLAEARALFPDDSDLVIALREMLKNRRLTPAELRVVEEALERVEEEADLKRLRSGINTAIKARLYGERMKLDSASIREAYRDFILSERRGLDSYQAWVTIFGPPKRGMMVDFIEAALLADRDASQPSCSDDDFGILLGKLQEIRTIRSADEVFIRLFMTKQVVQDVNPSQTDWLFFLFSVLYDSTAVKAAFKEALKTDLTLLAARSKAEIVQWLHFCISRLPFASFSDDKARETLLQNIRSLSHAFYQEELKDINPL